MCGGWLRRIVSVVVLMIIVVVEQAQEHHGEEHENEGLQKGHKQFEEVEGEARSGTNNGSDLGASQILQDTKAKAKEGSHHGVSGDHVGEQTNGQRKMA